MAEYLNFVAEIHRMPEYPSVQPVPLAAGHVVPVTAGNMSTPPTTAYCEAHYHIACYQPFQLQRAYNLAPLFSKGALTLPC